MAPPDEVKVPLTEFVREVAREAAREASRNQQAACGIQDVKKDVQSLKTRFAALVAFMVGSGILGGVISGLLVR